MPDQYVAVAEWFLEVGSTDLNLGQCYVEAAGAER
jgi:hypothetical protein